jgi:hypothetical protein
VSRRILRHGVSHVTLNVLFEMTQAVVREGTWILSEINFSLHYFTIMLASALEIFMTDELYQRQ